MDRFLATVGEVIEGIVEVFVGTFVVLVGLSLSFLVFGFVVYLLVRIFN